MTKKQSQNCIAEPYRADIDGLRAIAVISVILYHFEFGFITGGFVGVDIFFVISGYLITSIISKEIADNSFTFSGFYERRVRRIFPALIAMLMAVSAAAPFLLLPSDLKLLSDSLISTLTFSSNVIFWRQSGYFEPSSQLNPLLHTWSLAVEEQFYIGFPILMVLGQRYARGKITVILATVTILSLALCIFAQPIRPTAAFFLSPFRAWELLIGGLLALKALPPLKNSWFREATSAVGLGIVACSLAFLKEGPAFPGWQALLPVLGAAALIHSGSGGSGVVSRLLAWRPLVLVGLASYSLYLWHWPLVAYFRQASSVEHLAGGAKFALIILSLLAGWTSYRWVETPFRQRNGMALLSSRRSLFAGAAIATLLLIAIAILVRVSNGFPERLPRSVAVFDQQRFPPIPYQHCDSQHPATAPDTCFGGKTDGQQIAVLWGDSFALAWGPAMDTIAKRAGIKLVMAANSACPPLFDVRNPADPDCLDQNNRFKSYLKNARPDVVIMVAAWTGYSVPGGFYTLESDVYGKGNGSVFPASLHKTITEVAQYAGRIILVGPTPGAPGDLPYALAKAEWWQKKPPPAFQTEYVRNLDRWFWKEARRLDGAGKLHLIDPVPWFCAQGRCRYIDPAGQVLYRDGSHLSVAGSRLVAEHFPTILLNGTSASR